MYCPIHLFCFLWHLAGMHVRRLSGYTVTVCWVTLTVTLVPSNEDDTVGSIYV